MRRRTTADVEELLAEMAKERLEFWESIKHRFVELYEFYQTNMVRLQRLRRVNSLVEELLRYACVEAVLMLCDWMKVQASRLDAWKVIAKSTQRIIASDDDSIRCVVCLSNYLHGEEVRKLRCQHEFHSSCIDEWLVRNPSCPICRCDFGIPRPRIVLGYYWPDNEGMGPDPENSLNSLNSIDE
jgi:hypothetical protein